MKTENEKLKLQIQELQDKLKANKQIHFVQKQKAGEAFMQILTKPKNKQEEVAHRMKVGQIFL